MTDYDKLTVVKLREELVRRGLPKTGLKAALVQRLVEADAQAEQQPPGTERTDVETPPEARPKVKESTAVSEEISEPRKAPAQTDPEASDDAPHLSPAGAVAQRERALECAVPMANGIPEQSPVRRDEVIASMTTTSAETAGLNDQEQQGIPETQRGTKHDTDVTHEPSTTVHDDADNKANHEEATAATASTLEAQTSPSVVPAISTQISTLGGEEVREDTSKRKRRSQTPPPSSVETAQKRAKTGDGQPHVRLPEDDRNKTISRSQQNPELGDSAMVDAPADAVLEKATEEPNVNGDAETLEGAESHESINSRGEDVEATKVSSPPKSRGTEDEERLLPAEREQISAPDDTVGTPPKQSTSDTRFKNLFTGPPKREISPSRQRNNSGDGDRVISPALHPATSALYIRDLLRPIKAEILKEYLIALASPPATDPDPEIITEFFLDNVKTHCLVAFANTVAAARVRLGLHDRVWPDEKNRKPLWVDFVPEEKLSRWIEVENEAASDRRQGMKKWEVVYEEEDGGVMAFLQEAGPNSSAPRAVQPMMPRTESVTGARGMPSVPKARDEAARTSQPGPAAKSDAGKGFQALDQLFKVTAAKPMLYYLPVSQVTVDRRLDRLAAGRGGGKSDEKRRYTFEDGILVDKGPEFGFGRRGGYGGRGGGGYGGYQGRGGGYRGDNWRGRR